MPRDTGDRRKGDRKSCTQIEYHSLDFLAKTPRPRPPATTHPSQRFHSRPSGAGRTAKPWHRIIAWGKLGEYAANLIKGAHLQIEGEIRTRDYVQKPSGEKSDEVKKTITEIRATSIAKLDRTKKDGESVPDAEGAAA